MKLPAFTPRVAAACLGAGVLFVLAAPLTRCGPKPAPVVQEQNHDSSTASAATATSASTVAIATSTAARDVTRTTTRTTRRPDGTVEKVRELVQEHAHEATSTASDARSATASTSAETATHDATRTEAPPAPSPAWRVTFGPEWRARDLELRPALVLEGSRRVLALGPATVDLYARGERAPSGRLDGAAGARLSLSW